MKPIEINSTQLTSLIRNVAKQELLPRFARVTHKHKADGSIVTEADLAAQQSIATQLKQNWPNTLLLGEEMTSEQQAKILSSEQPIWCLDPLDGTSNFAAGIPYFAISLSLICQGEVVLGLVYDPIRDECFFSRKEANNRLIGFLNDQRLTAVETQVNLSQATAIVDFKRLSNDLASRLVTERPFSSQRNFGASALDWCWLAIGRGHIYLHGNQNLWDYAAGELILRSVGGQAVTLDGEAVFIKALQKRSVVAAINDALFNEWTQWLNISIKN